MLTARIIHRAIGLASLVLILVILWNIREMFFPSPQSYSEEQVKCFAAILRADTINEEGGNRPRAQELIADVVNRVRDVSGDRLTYCEILQGGITLYPPGWKHTLFFWGRDADTIRNSKNYIGSPWIDAEKRAREFLGADPDPDRCAKYIVRPDPWYNFWTNETTAAQQIEKTMKPDPQKEPGLKTKFYCP